MLDLLVAAVNTPLSNRNYAIVHADTSDARGIDVAFIYDDDLFDAPATEVKRHATREIVQVNFQTHKNRTWSIFGNHWPSRSGGQVLGSLPDRSTGDRSGLSDEAQT